MTGMTFCQIWEELEDEGLEVENWRARAHGAGAKIQPALEKNARKGQRNCQPRAVGRNGVSGC